MRAGRFGSRVPRANLRDLLRITAIDQSIPVCRDARTRRSPPSAWTEARDRPPGAAGVWDHRRRWELAGPNPPPALLQGARGTGARSRLSPAAKRRSRGPSRPARPRRPSAPPPAPTGQASRTRIGPAGEPTKALPFDHVVVVMMEEPLLRQLTSGCCRKRGQRAGADGYMFNRRGAARLTEIRSRAATSRPVEGRQHLARRRCPRGWKRHPPSRFNGGSHERVREVRPAVRWSTGPTRTFPSTTRSRRPSRWPTVGSARRPAQNLSEPAFHARRDRVWPDLDEHGQPRGPARRRTGRCSTA